LFSSGLSIEALNNIAKTKAVYLALKQKLVELPG
jgi:hypothetical protein